MPAQVNIGLTTLAGPMPWCKLNNSIINSLTTTVITVMYFVGILSQVAWTATAHGALDIKPLLSGIKLLLLGLNSLP